MHFSRRQNYSANMYAPFAHTLYYILILCDCHQFNNKLFFLFQTEQRYHFMSVETRHPEYFFDIFWCISKLLYQ